jgi:hypothetical protein
MHGIDEECIQVWGQSEGKRSLGKTRCRWEDNIKTDLREKERGHMDWICLAQDKEQWQTHANPVTKPSGSIKCLEILT